MRGLAPEISAVVVNHRSAAHAIRCVASLREAMGGEKLAGEVLLVDCASGEEEALRLQEARADALILLKENRGYSGGLNAGLARARGENLLLCNADVLFRPGTLRPLLDAVSEESVGAASPVLFWDEGDHIRLPPGYSSGLWTDLCQQLGTRMPGWKHRFAAFARHSLRLWREGGPAAHLAGAILMVRREVFDRVGRFDERFLFEYEETEWEERVRSARLTLKVVAASRARHLWARSAAESEEAGERRERSRAAYRNLRYGSGGRAVLEAMEKLGPAVNGGRRTPHPAVPRRPGAALAISPNASLLPFASASLEEDFRLPADLEDGLPPGPLFLTTFRESDGWPLETRVWVKER